MKSIDLSIIIPLLNEEDNLPTLFRVLDEFILQKSNISIEVLFVDDGSDDSSSSLIEHYQFRYPVKLIKLSKNFGSHAALRAGYLESNGEYVTNLYADLQETLELIFKMYQTCLNQFDIVWAYRKKVNNSIMDRLFSLAYGSLIRTFVNKNYPYSGIDCVIFNSRVKRVINDNVERNSSFALQLLTSGFKQTFVEYVKESRKRGKSKWTLSKKIKILIDSFISFSYAPIRFVSITGVLLFGVGTVWSIYLIFRKIFIGDLALGWAALISILLIGFGITNISLGIMSEYLWRVLDETRGRPVYIIKEITQIS